MRRLRLLKGIFYALEYIALGIAAMVIEKFSDRTEAQKQTNTITVETTEASNDHA